MNLSQAWQFLSGECGMFEALADWTSNPSFAEFSVFMPLMVNAESRTAGVGVLIKREDATIVASHMFGLAKDQVNEDDLRDACAEVCNVFSGCVTPQVSLNSDIQIGLPQLASEDDFDRISKGSVVTLSYMCDGAYKSASEVSEAAATARHLAKKGGVNVHVQETSARLSKIHP